MSLAAKTINGTTWVALTAAGESGSVWIKEGVDSNEKGQVSIYVWHGTTPPSGDAPLAVSKRIYRPIGNADVMQITADNTSDIFYARGLTAADGATLIVDVV